MSALASGPIGIRSVRMTRLGLSFRLEVETSDIVITMTVGESIDGPET